MSSSCDEEAVALRYADEVAKQKSAIFWIPEGRPVAIFIRVAENPDLEN
jgi:hypothetical protein